MTEITVRWLGPADVTAFREIRLEALRLEPQYYASAYEDWCDRPVEDFERLLSDIRYVAAQSKERLLGIAGWFPAQMDTTCHRGKLVAVYVRPAWRNRGLFSTMMRAVLADAQGQVSQLELQVSAENISAMAAYRAHGFTEIGRIPDALNHDGRFSDEVIMLRGIGA